jgi:hypothetical protein
MRRAAFLSVAGVAAVALIVLVTTVWLAAATAGEVGLLIGGLDSYSVSSIAFATLMCAGAVSLFAAPIHGWWPWLVVPAGIVLGLGALLSLVVAAFICERSTTPLQVDGCDSGYVVVEESFLFAGWGTVYQQDGIIVHRVERTSTDDGYRPFAVGAYGTKRAGEGIQVWYNFEYQWRAGVDTHREPDFTLPARPGHGC